MSIGSRLRELREAAAMSQTELAKIAGVTRNAVSQWEAGATQPSTKRLSAVAQALGVPVDLLIAPSVQTRERVIEAATRLFDRLGYHETSVDVVCASADITVAEFQAMFGSKQELLYAVLEAYNNRTFGDLRRIPPKYGSLDARLMQLLRIYYVHDLAHLKLTAAFLAYSWEWSQTRERDNLRQLSDHHDLVMSMFDEARQAGEIDAGNYRAASDLLLAAYTFSLRHAIFDGYDADKLVETILPEVHLILRGCGWRKRAESDNS